MDDEEDEMGQMSIEIKPFSKSNINENITKSIVVFASRQMKWSWL